MPGIAGMISRRPAEQCESRLRAMVGTMEHENFYTSGMHLIPAMGIYGGWIAHEESFAANQVFFNEHKDITLIFSGECFVDPETPANLSQKGHALGKKEGDWLVHLYEEEGNQFFEKLNGLFSGLLIDQRQRKAFLFNDRYGVDRIYWHEADGEFYFASEAKALLRILPELREFDIESVAQFLTFGCTLEERTLFRSINTLPGGSVWSFGDGNCERRKYFSPEIWEAQPVLLGEAYVAKFEGTLKKILPRYFKSESKIGISLTAGLDSRMIMACRPATAYQPICYTFTGETGRTLDDRLAARVANTCSCEHQLIRIGREFFSDFAAHADRTVYVTDGCFGILGAHEIYLNRKARCLSPVRLTGNYGSEVLRSMSTFKAIPLSRSLFAREFGNTLNFSSVSLTNSVEHPVTFAAFKEIPWNLFGSLAAGRSQSFFRSPYLDNQIVALAYQAPQNFRASSVPARRLIRDNNVSLSDIPTDMGDLGNHHGLAAASRRIFSKATFKLDYLYNEGLPHWLSPLDSSFRRLQSLRILGLHKYLHYRSWFQKELADYLNDALAAARAQPGGFWNSAFLECMAREHIRSRRNYVLEINAVLTLEAIERLLFRDLPRGTSSRLRHLESENAGEESLLTR
jgi:asparagine synthase (glutamine-hydrolysing)